MNSLLHIARVRLAAFALLLLPALAVADLRELSDDVLSDTVGQALLVSDKIAGEAGSNTMFYRMTLDAQLEMNMNIDRLQLGCGGLNDGIVNGACDIDLDYVRMLGRTASGGQSGAPGSGAAATSLFKMVRPYLEIAVLNDGDATRRQIIGFKIGAQSVDGYMGIGRYINSTDPDYAASGCTTAQSGVGAYKCNRGINRISGYLGTRFQGDVYGCFNIFGCTVNPDPAQQDHVAAFDAFIKAWGTRMNRVQASISATADFLNLSVTSNVDSSLRFIHGMAIDPSATEYTKDDFFMSFQRQAVKYPTFNKTGQTQSGGIGYSYAANPGWWMNVPYAELTGLKAYNVSASGANLFVAVTLSDADVGQRPPSNCYGSMKFC